MLGSQLIYVNKRGPSSQYVKAAQNIEKTLQPNIRPRFQVSSQIQVKAEKYFGAGHLNN